jgi:CRP-like cAMP-binding protein
MTLTSIIKTLSNFRLFEGFSPEKVWEIFSEGKVVQLEPGETLISQGITNKTLYLLIDGELGVILEKDGVEVAIRIPPGECLGEMSLVAGHPTSARAIARKRSRVLLISEDTFWSKLATTRSGGAKPCWA